MDDSPKERIDLVWAEVEIEFHFGYVKFRLSVNYFNTQVKQASEHMNLKLRREVKKEDKHLKELKRK